MDSQTTLNKFFIYNDLHANRENFFFDTINSSNNNNYYYKLDSFSLRCLPVVKRFEFGNEIHSFNNN